MILLFFIVTYLIYKFIHMVKDEWKTSNSKYGAHRSQSMNSKTRVGRSTLEYLKQNDYKNFIHEQQNIAQRQRQGLFTQPVGIGPGDLYQDPKPYKPQKNVEVNGRMQQKVGPELFSKVSSTNIGDVYKDKFRQQQLYIKEKADMSIHPYAFNAGNKQKLIKNSEFKHMKQYSDKQYNTRNENGKVVVAPKNFVTCQMKKGYGNTTNGHLFSNYPYMGDNYDDAKNKDRTENLKHKAKIPVPFATGQKLNGTFTPGHQLADSHKPYQDPKQFDTCRSKSSGNWKYNNPNKKGQAGTFTKFPQYIQQGDPQIQKKGQQPIWKPNFNGTSKGYGQTLHRPCPPPSHMTLNNIKAKN